MDIHAAMEQIKEPHFTANFCSLLQGMLESKEGEFPPTMTPTMKEANLFLAAYIIHHFPAQCLPHCLDTHAVQLRLAAQGMLKQFHILLFRVMREGVGIVDNTLLKQMVLKYAIAFKEWQTVDKPQMEGRMLQALNELHSALESQPPPSEEMRSNINSKIAWWKEKLRILAQI